MLDQSALRSLDMTTLPRLELAIEAAIDWREPFEGRLVLLVLERGLLVPA